VSGWYDRVWFSTDGILDSSSIDVGDYYYNLGVPEAGIYSQTNSVVLPVSSIGSYTLFVPTDIYNQIYESNKINNISAPVTVRLLPPLSFNTSPTGTRWTSNGFQMELDGLDGSGLVIYASSNLVSWLPIYTNSTASGTLQFLDSRATNFLHRFYRAVEQ
jgi:hypothetical protein